MQGVKYEHYVSKEIFPFTFLLHCNYILTYFVYFCDFFFVRAACVACFAILAVFIDCKEKK